MKRIRSPILMACVCVFTAGCGTQILYAGFSDKNGGSQFSNPYSPPGTPTGDKILREGFSSPLIDFVDQSNGGITGTSLRLNSSNNANKALSFESTTIGTAVKKYTFAWDGKKTGGSLAFDCHFGDESNQPLGLRFFNGQVMIPGGGTTFGSIPDGVQHRVFVSMNTATNSYRHTITAQGVPQAQFSGGLPPTLADSPDKMIVKCEYQGFTPTVGAESYVFDKMEFRKKK